MMNILILGPQGSGKGTQAKLISDKFKIPHISTGDMFRENISKKTELGKKAEAFIKSGQLVPDELTIALVKDRLSRIDAKSGYILDGFPRNDSQAEALDKITKVQTVLNITLHDDIAVKRISSRRTCEKCGAIYSAITDDIKKGCVKCGGKLIIRADDTPKAVMDRLKIYHEKTKPLIDYYTKKKILLEIDGDRPVEVVFAEIEKGLNKLK
jgi:adenylate kinase